jgi:hypothetical protein
MPRRGSGRTTVVATFGGTLGVAIHITLRFSLGNLLET